MHDMKPYAIGVYYPTVVWGAIQVKTILYGNCKVLGLLNSLCTHDVLVSAAGELNPYNTKIDLLILDSGTFVTLLWKKNVFHSLFEA